MGEKCTYFFQRDFPSLEISFIDFSFRKKYEEKVMKKDYLREMRERESG